MVYLAVLTSAPLLPLVTAYQEGVSQDVCILTRLGHDFSDGGDLGPVRAVMAPWLDRVGFRFIHELCPLLLLSYALEYGRVDLVRELMAMQKLCFSHHDWTLLYGAWSRCVCKHRHLQWQYTTDIDGKVHDGNGAFHYPMRANGTSILGSVHHLAVAACLGDHVDLFRFAMDKDAGLYLPNFAFIALRGSKLCIVQDLFDQGIISSFKAHHVRLAVMTGSTDLLAFLLANSSRSTMAEAFEQAATQRQFALLQWLCTTYNEPLYWRLAFNVAVANLQLDVIAYFSTVHNLHLTPAEAARVQRRRKRLNDDDGPTRVPRSRN